MKRRTLIRTVGAAGIATATLSGSGAATAERPSIDDLGIERELDVASVEGRVTLDTLLEPHDREALPADVDPSEYTVSVAPEADSITVQDCCAICCSQMLEIRCFCTCCTCDPESCN